MKEVNEHIDDLIAKYLSGEAQPEEAIELEEWKQAAAENLAYFENVNKTFLFIHGEKQAHQTDVDRMYQSVLDNIDVPVQPKVIHFNFRQFFTPLRAAAAVVFIVAGAWLIARMSDASRQQQMAFQSGNAVVEQQLSDGSQVTLSKNTSLQLAEGYNGKERRMKLSGEATFKVVHMDEKPFVIEANGVLVTDIGTVFTVDAQPSSDSVFVTVSEGVVQMSAQNNSLTLHQNQVGLYIRSQQKLVDVMAETKVANARVFHFSGHTLDDVIKALNAVYAEQISLANKDLEKCRITVDFNNEPVEVIVGVIAETLGLTYEQTETGYRLSGASCSQ